MKIKYIDGTRFSRAIMAGAKRIFDRQEYLNKINVFPIPDADTGTNMASTLSAIVDSISNQTSTSIDNITKKVADSALLGAQGNSGVIFAQFFYGLSEGIADDMRICTEKFGNAVLTAISSAHDALSHPLEGTILSVIKDWGESVYNNRKTTRDFVELLNNSLKAARISLEETRTKLEIMRKANVVDAGAQGFVDFIEGVIHFISKGKIGELQKYQTPVLKEIDHLDLSLEDIKYRYCTECLIQGDHINIKDLRQKIEDYGDSVVLAGSEQKARLHIHTNEPAKVFALVGKRGVLLQQKAEDMHRQYLVTHRKHPAVAIVADSACDLPEEVIEKYNIHLIPVRLSFGPATYIDKITITPEYFYEMLEKNPLHPTTSQPPPSEFKNLYSFLLSHYDSVISIQLTGALSGTFQNAVNAAKSFTEKKITVIDSKTISVNMGYMIQKAAQMAADNISHEKIVETITSIADRTRLVIGIPDITCLMKGGRIGKAKGIIAKLFNIKPILYFDNKGKIQHFDKSFSNKGVMKKTFQYVKKFIKDKKGLRFFVTHANSPETAKYYIDRIKKEFGVGEVLSLPVSPVLGVHSGNGAGAIGIVWGEE